MAATGTPAAEALQAVRETLAALREGRLDAHTAAARLREPAGLLERLPPVFTTVWHPLLDRLESSALFDAESCSFSQRDLHDSLQQWVDQAAGRLARTGD